MDKFYTYQIYDPINNMYYIGSRCRKGIFDPYDDFLYMGTVTSEKWKTMWPEIVKRSEKYILGVFLTREEALAHEVALHEEHNVNTNSLYYNEAKQTSIGFSTAGCKLSEAHKEKLKGPRPSVQGKNNALFGTKNKKHSELMSKRVGTNSSAYKSAIFTFYHDQHGVFTGTMYSLRTKYKLEASNLTAVIKGRRKTIKGWRLKL